jgi:8-oxo-dGTP diphosphatase
MDTTCYRATVTSPSADPAEPRLIHVSAAVITDEAGRLLLVRKAGTTAFMQPGGKPELGESASQTLSRELAEELGIFVAADELRPLGSFTAAAANEPGHLVVADVFAADIGAQGPEVGAEIAELRWITRADAEHLEIAPLARTYFLPAD